MGFRVFRGDRDACCGEGQVSVWGVVFAGACSAWGAVGNYGGGLTFVVVVWGNVLVARVVIAAWVSEAWSGDGGSRAGPGVFFFFPSGECLVSYCCGGWWRRWIW